MQFSTDSTHIFRVLGAFPSKCLYNPFGLFKKGGHIVSVYLQTNTDFYWCIQCETPDCPGHGYQTQKCSHIKTDRLCFPGNYCGKSQAIQSVLADGFQYVEVWNVDGECVYFDQTGERVPILNSV